MTAEQERDAHLRVVWNTLMFFASESSYTMGERTGGVLAGCPRNPPPTYAEMACYARQAAASLVRYFGREPEEWLTVGVCSPPTPPEHPAAPFTKVASDDVVAAMTELHEMREHGDVDDVTEAAARLERLKHDAGVAVDRHQVVCKKDADGS